MIFRFLYRRRVTRLFGPLMSAESLARVLAEDDNISEWAAMRFVLIPSWLKRLIDGPEKTASALLEVRRMALDTLGQPKNKFIRARVNIRLLPTAAGGRTSPLKGQGSYRPNHNFFGPDNREMTMGFIELPPGKEFLPGEKFEAEISFFYWDRLEGEIYPGREWRIQEGPKLVGMGTVLEVHSDR
jgi:elongation factor Tu